MEEGGEREVVKQSGGEEKRKSRARAMGGSGVSRRSGTGRDSAGQPVSPLSGEAGPASSVLPLPLSRWPHLRYACSLPSSKWGFKFNSQNFPKKKFNSPQDYL